VFLLFCTYLYTSIWCSSMGFLLELATTLDSKSVRERGKERGTSNLPKFKSCFCCRRFWNSFNCLVLSGVYLNTVRPQEDRLWYAFLFYLQTQCIIAKLKHVCTYQQISNIKFTIVAYVCVVCGAPSYIHTYIHM